MILDFLRILVALPLIVGEAVWERVTRDEEEAFIAEQRQRFIDWAADQ